MTEEHLIKVTKETSSDETALLAQWYSKSGSKVKKGQVIVSLETSKAVFDIEAPADGYLYYRHEEGVEVQIGEVIAVITHRKDFSIEDIRAEVVNKGEKQEKTKFSRKANAIIEEKGLDKKLFHGKGLVTEKDVLDHLESLHARSILKPAAKDLKVLIFGGGGHAKMCIDILKQTKTYEIYGIIDDVLKISSEVMGIPVIGRKNDLKYFYDEGFHLIINGVGAAISHPVREKIFQDLKKIGFHLPNIIHPRASLEPSAALGEGNQFMANATIGSDVKIGDNCIVNSGAIVSHDSVLDDNVHIAPGAVLAGSVTVGKNTIIGMNAAVYLQLSIGENVVIYNGCNIFKDVPSNTVVRGNIVL